MQVKICGLSEIEHVEEATNGGARYLGFVFFEKSPRNLTVDAARELMIAVPEGICKVALTVNPTDDFLDNITTRLPVDMLQLHGTETPERAAGIRSQFGLPVMKAVGVADVSDLATLDAYSDVVDQLLVDAKPPKESELPGGNGLSFDWRLIAGRHWQVPWMLAGGLTPENVSEAIALTGANQIDVSSGVESAPGVKDTIKIEAFLKAADVEPIA